MEVWYQIPARSRDDSTGNQLYLHIESSNFLINHEFFGPIVEGYTLPGHIVQPSLSYQAGRHFNLEAGIHVKQFYGENESLKIRPVFTAALKFSDELKLNMGTLQGNVHHRMLDALFFHERNVSHPLENGIQLLVNRERLWADVWLNWEQFIREGDTFPEIFTAGLSIRQTLINDERGWSIVLPLQGIVVHEGGQISDFDTPTQSLVNVAGGIEVLRDFNGWIRQAGFFTHYVGYKDLREVNVHEIYHGQGFYAGLLAKSNALKLMLGYWDVNDFIAPRGNPIYQSVSFIHPDEVHPNRQLITGKLAWHRAFSDDLHFSFLFEGYYDVPISHFDYGYGIFLSYTPRFFLTRFE